MGNPFKPGQINTPRNDVTNLFSGLLAGGIRGGFDVGGRLAQGFTLPGYQGAFGAETNPYQTQGANALSQALSGYDQGTGQNILSQFLQTISGGASAGQGGIEGRVNNIPGTDTLGAASAGNLPLQQLLASIGGSLTQSATNPIAALMQLGSGGATSANPALAALLGFKSTIPGLDQLMNFSAGVGGERGGLQDISGVTPEQALLRQFVSGSAGGAQSALSNAQSMLTSFGSLPAVQSLLSGGGADIGSVFQALDAQRRIGLNRDIGDLREQFSSQGLRFGTDLANAVTRRQGESETGLNAQMASLLPALLQSQTGAQTAGLNFLAQIPQTLTQLGLGQQGNVVAGLAQAGGLGLTGQGTRANALASSGQLGLGEAGMQADLLKLIPQLALQGQGLNLEALKAAAGTGSADLSSLVQALTSAGNLGINQGAAGADVLKNLLTSQTGAAGTLGQESLAGTDILSQFMTAEGAQRLQALLGAPGALQTISAIPTNLATSTFNAGQQMFENQDAAIQRQIADFQANRQLLPLLFSFLGGTPPPVTTPSPFDTVMNAFGQVTDTVTGAKVLKKGGIK